MDFNGPVPGIPGATIRRVDELPEHLPDGVAIDKFCSAKRGQLLFTVPNLGRFFARDGTTIELTVESGADMGLVVLYLNGSARGALIHQRGELPLHAATLVPPGGDAALAICGPSGAGKSTLAAELSRRGWTLVADDTTRVTSGGSEVNAWPSRDSIKLWRDACEAVNIDVSTLERVGAQMEKYYLRVPARATPVKLGVVVELVPNETPGAEPMTIGEKMALITRNTYRPAYIRPLERQREHMSIVAQTAVACRVFRLASDRSVPVRVFADSVERAIGFGVLG